MDQEEEKDAAVYGLSSVPCGGRKEPKKEFGGEDGSASVALVGVAQAGEK